MSKIEIREATPEDSEALYEMVERLRDERDLYIVGEGLPGSPEEERAFLDYINTDRSLVLLAFSGELVVGNSISTIGAFDMNKHTAEIGISVVNGFRDRGIGTDLMERSLDWLREKGVIKASIQVFSPNKDGIRFYERLGFFQEGLRERQWLFKGEYISEVIMAKWL